MTEALSDESSMKHLLDDGTGDSSADSSTECGWNSDWSDGGLASEEGPNSMEGIYEGVSDGRLFAQVFVVVWSVLPFACTWEFPFAFSMRGPAWCDGLRASAPFAVSPSAAPAACLLSDTEPVCP